MNDLISKKVVQDALIEKISRLNAEGERSINTAREFIRFKRYIDGITPVQGRPKGEWKHNGGDEWYCSECLNVIFTEGSWEHPLETNDFFCEYCGSDMRGEE